MQVRISDWAWLECDGFTEQQLGKIRSSLTIQPRRTSKYQQEVKPIHLYREREGWIGLPRSFFLENQKLLHQVEDETSKGHEVDIEFDGTLKEDQAKAVERVVSGADTGEPGGIVQASPGWGKTVTGIGIWLAMKTSALVVVQREYLVNQWIKRIERFAPGAKVGRIKGEQCEFGEDYDISVATIQSLVSRRYDYPEELWDAFGLVICDEIHRIGAPTWAGVVPNFRAAYRLGLTATPRRMDGADNVFFWHIGPVIYRSKTKRVTPRLRRVYTDFKLVRTPNFNPNLASKQIQLRFLCANPERNQRIVQELVKAVRAGRKVLVLSERRKHLERLREMFGSDKPEDCVVDFYVGGREQAELDVAEKADVVFATFQMAREALDIPDLDTLFLTTPVADIEQPVGRIMREHPEKKEPIVTDFIDRHVSSFVKLWNARRRFYVAEGMYKGED